MRWFWLRPRWVAFHLLAVAVVVGFLNLGLWQLRRLDERQETNRLIETRSRGPAVTLDRASQQEYRRVEVAGRYDASGQVLWRNRQLDGIVGRDVLTPLVLDDGSAAYVDRGFVPLEARVPAPPAGDVTVEGVVRATQRRGALGPQDPDVGRLSAVARVDLDRLQRQYDRDLRPVWVQLTAQQPAPGRDGPRPVPLPDLGNGPHLSYAVQWFSFTALAVAFWVMAMRRGAATAARGSPGATVSGPPGRSEATPLRS